MTNNDKQKELPTADVVIQTPMAQLSISFILLLLGVLGLVVDRK